MVLQQPLSVSFSNHTGPYSLRVLSALQILAMLSVPKSHSKSYGEGASFVPLLHPNFAGVLYQMN